MAGGERGAAEQTGQDGQDVHVQSEPTGRAGEVIMREDRSYKNYNVCLFVCLFVCIGFIVLMNTCTLYMIKKQPRQRY